MAEHPIPPKFRKFAEHLMATLWPGTQWPRLDMVLEDQLGAQGDMHYQFGDTFAKMRLARQRIFLDFVDTASTIAHELTHLYVDLTYGETDEAHGPEWRGEMTRIGLPVSEHILSDGSVNTRENVERGGLFWQAFQEFLAMELAPDLAPAAAADAALAAGQDNGIVNGPGVTQEARAHAEAANAALGSNRAPAIRQPTAHQTPAVRTQAPAPSTGRSPWSISGALSSMLGGGSSRQPQASAFAPIVAGPKAGNKRHLVFADCSMSMGFSMDDGDTKRFEAQREALRVFFREAKGVIDLMGFAANTVSFSSPETINRDYSRANYSDPSTSGLISGTSFMACFEHAAYLSGDWNRGNEPEHIHLFSDGTPLDESMDKIVASWNKTTCDVSTYYIGPAGDQTAISIMASLARGNGSAHVVSGEQTLVAAVRGEIGAGPVPFNVQARPPRAWDNERKATLDSVKATVANQTHLIRTAGTVADAMGRLSEVEQDIKFLKFATQAKTAVVDQANQVLSIIHEQYVKDEEQRRIAAARNDAWIEGAGTEINRLSSQHFSNQLLASAQQIADATNRTVLPSVTLQSIDPKAVARATALMSGRAAAPSIPSPQMARAPALPQGRGAPALPAPGRAVNMEMPANASREVALVPVNQKNTSRRG